MKDFIILNKAVDESGSIIEKYVYGLRSNMPEYIKRGNNKFKIISNHLGSPVRVVDSSGNIVKSIKYDTFGNIISDSAPEFELLFRFAGGIWDEDTKLVRFGVRDYDPEVGRWTAKEPLGFSGARNFYVYADGDAVNYWDLDGFLPFKYEDINRNPVTPKIINKLKELSPITEKMIEDLELSPYDIHLKGNQLNKMNNNKGFCSSDDNGQINIYYKSDAVILIHELMHAWNQINSMNHSPYYEELSAVQMGNILRRIAGVQPRIDYGMEFYFGIVEATQIPIGFENVWY